MALDLNQLRELLTAINETDIAELTLKSADFELTVRRGLRPDEQVMLVNPAQPSASAAASLPPTIAPTLPVASATQPELVQEESIPHPSSQPVPPPSNASKLLEITSPMVGTFYRSPAPDEAPFVEIGERVRKGQTVCIIEAMKLMNELESEVSGVIVEVLVQNGEPVEFGQPLMRVNPDG